MSVLHPVTSESPTRVSNESPIQTPPTSTTMSFGASWEIAVGIAGLMVAILTGPWLLPKLQGSAAEFRGLLEQGLIIVRLAAIGVVGLSYASYRSRTIHALQFAAQPPVRSTFADRFALLMIFLLGSLLTLPRLGTSLWWDELGTITRVVDRGPFVILTFSCQANNHLLNSCICFIVRQLTANLEIGVHLVPYLFFLLTIYTVFWMMRIVANFQAAAFAALALAIHPTVVTHAVEARGYSGAILFSALAIAACCGLVRGRWWRDSLVYVIASVTAVGFILTTIFVPFAHGLLGIGRWYLRRNQCSTTGNLISRPFDLILACLWTATLSLVMCGLMLPQIAKYSATAAEHDHLPLGIVLLTQSLFYLTGFRTELAALTLLALSGFGWIVGAADSKCRARRDIALASLLPLLVVAGYLLLPGTHCSPRFFCFLIVPTCCGIGFGLDWLARQSRPAQIFAGICLLLWTVQLTEIHASLLTINRPNLKQLAAELRGTRVVLVGPQADANQFYFSNATWFHSVEELTETFNELPGPEVIIEGRLLEENRLDVPNLVLDRYGYRIERVLPSAVANETEFVVYRRYGVQSEVEEKTKTNHRGTQAQR